MTTSPTSIQKFTSGVAGYLTQSVLPTLCEWLTANKGVSVTVQECMQALEMPAPAAPPTPSHSLPGLQNIPQAAKAPAKRPTATSNGPKCPFIFTRGKSEGQACGASVKEGETFCNTCKKKKAAGGPGTTSGGAASAGAGLKSAAKPKTATELEVNELPEKDWYREVHDNFIIHRLPDNKIVAVAVDDDGKFRQLTAAEKIAATKKGLQIVNDSVPLNIPAAIPNRKQAGLSAVPAAAPAASPSPVKSQPAAQPQPQLAAPAMPQINLAQLAPPVMPNIGIPQLPRLG